MRLIDADALKTELDAWARIIQKPNHYAREDALYIIDCALTIDAAPVVRGEWSQRSCFGEDENVYVCSVCDEPWTLTAGTPLENNMHHCPNCGARMEDKPCG